MIPNPRIRALASFALTLALMTGVVGAVSALTTFDYTSEVGVLLLGVAIAAISTIAVWVPGKRESLEPRMKTRKTSTPTR